MYLIDDVNEKNIPVFSVAFWGEGDDISKCLIFFEELNNN